MVNGFLYYRALESVSIASELCPPLLPFTHARSESINADSLNSNFLQLGRRSGGRPQQTVHPRRLPVNTVIHTTLVGSNPQPSDWSLVDCWSDALPVVPPTHQLCFVLSVCYKYLEFHFINVYRFYSQINSQHCYVLSTNCCLLNLVSSSAFDVSILLT